LPTLPSTIPGALPNDSHDELDLSGVWSITQAFTVRVGVENLTNAQPEIVGRIPGVNNAMGTTDPTGNYDVLGRRYYIGMSANF
jgi:iron complex outermembrane receptor protein